jgi:hypothetical protein
VRGVKPLGTNAKYGGASEHHGYGHEEQGIGNRVGGEALRRQPPIE